MGRRIGGCRTSAAWAEAHRARIVAGLAEHGAQGVLADLRERVKALEGDVVDMQKETAVRKARLAGLGRLRPLWVFFLVFALSARFSGPVDLALLALFSFFALREYFLSRRMEVLPRAYSAISEQTTMACEPWPSAMR